MEASKAGIFFGEKAKNIKKIKEMGKLRCGASRSSFFVDRGARLHSIPDDISKRLN